MPQLEELQYYFRGLWLLVLGRLEGFGWLDFSERGFWRSWWALAFCLPPMMLSWAAYRVFYLSALPKGAVAGPSFIAKIAITDFGSWFFSYLALAVVMTLSGYGRTVAAMVIAVNWLSVPLQWLSIFASLAMIFAPNNLELYQSALFSLLIISGIAHFMVIRQLAERRALPATAFFLALMVASIWSASTIGNWLGV